MKKRLLYLICIVLIAFLSGCGKNGQPEEGKQYQIYYLNDKNTKVTSVDYVSATTDKGMLLDEIFKLLQEKPLKGSYEAVLHDESSLVNYYVIENNLTLNLDERFKTIDPIKSILIRAALTRTMTQINGIDTVAITVNNEALLDASGNIVGPMRAEMFIDNAGNEINALETVKLTMYFATEDGKGLETVYRTLEYNSNISMEKLVVEQLIGGPVGATGRPTINPATKLVSVTTKDGVCYVNLDSNFLTQIYEVDPEVTIYSIVNSLVELSNINKVQFSIDGETNVTYREKMSFSNVYERNLDLVVR